jgi:hypothetical protein
MHRNSFFFCSVFAFLFSACDPGTGPGGLGDVRDDIVGHYDAELVDPEYTCPPNLYMPLPPVGYGMTVVVVRACTDPEECTPEELEGDFTIHLILSWSDSGGSGGWTFGSDVMVSASGEFDKTYLMHFVDGTPADVSFFGVVRHGELDATYVVDMDSGGGTSCRNSATIRGVRDDE